jgi:hypothetical protein
MQFADYVVEKARNSFLRVSVVTDVNVHLIAGTMLLDSMDKKAPVRLRITAYSFERSRKCVEFMA